MPDFSSQKSWAIVACVVGLVTASFAAQAGTWPQFRGPGSRGVAESADLPTTWSTTENIAWHTPIPGRGWSSPVVAGDLVLLTTVVNSGETEAPKKGLYFGGERPEPPATPHQWKVIALDQKTGEIRWDRVVHEGNPESSVHVKNTYASETPVTDGERLYVYFGAVGLFCLDMTGKTLWEKPIEARKMRYGWGTAASPALHEGHLYLVNDNEEGSYLLALDAKTGDEVWKVDRDESSNWSTPYVWENSVRTEIVTLGSDAVRSYDTMGKLLWELRGMSSITIATPYANGDLLYFSSGYVGDRKHRPIYAVRAGGEGDISLKEGETENAWIAWSQPMAAPYNPSTILYKERLYVLYDRGQVSCYNAADGTPVYEKERLPKGAGFTASPWASGDQIYCLNEDGTTFVLSAGDQFEVIATNTLGENDMGMATPAIADDTLLLRTASALYAIKK